MTKRFRVPPTITRPDLDVYDTPVEFARKVLAEVPTRDIRSVLDLGAGSGNLGQAARYYWPTAVIEGRELRPLPKPAAYDEWKVGDVLTSVIPKADLLICNPPFTKFNQFMQVIGSWVTSGQDAVVIANLDFLSGKSRYQEVWQQYGHLVVKLMVPIWRVQFIPGKTGINFIGILLSLDGKEAISWLTP